MNTRRITLALFAPMLLCLLAAYVAPQAAHALTNKQRVGKYLFFDAHLSQPAGESCASCHGHSVGWTGPSASVNLNGAVYPGAVVSRHGNRKPPSVAYAGASPKLHYDATDGTWVGGMFWDGRATGDTLGDPLAEQAEGPFLNPLEQNNPSAAAVVAKVKKAAYAPLFKAVWGAGIFSDSDAAYTAIARSIAAFERSKAVSSYTSKYDAYEAGRVKLAANQQAGLTLFTGKAGCSGCHVPPAFTDYTYDNLGIPNNPLNPFYSETDYNPLGATWVDEGLGAYLESTGADASVYMPQLGKFKVPTLRNVAKAPAPGFVKAYGHNGYFKSLWSIVHFYNTRDTLPWPPPEYAATVNHVELGNLGLTTKEELQVVAFLKTLSDGYKVPR
jgi:cytochrome c peroxidase